MTNLTKEVAVKQAPVVASVPPALKDGDNVLISGVIAAQVNPLTNQRIPKAAPVIAAYDKWIGIQLAAGVLLRHQL